MKRCPFCAEEIQDAAVKCRYCGSELPGFTSSSAKPVGASKASSLTPEKTYYSDQSITVTSTRAVLGSKTYAMANITSVSMTETQPGAGCGCAVLAFGGLLALGLVSSETVGVGVFGLLLLIVGAVLMSQKSYIVRIGSASGEANALQNNNKEYVAKIVSALNQAIIDRR